MYIYRIQDENDVGYIIGSINYNPKIFYELDYGLSHELPDGSERKQHPDSDIGTDLHKAYFDGLIYRGSPLIFGFISIKDLYTWCSPVEIGFLEANGMNIYIYDVPEPNIIKGTRQVVFDPIYATKKIKILHKDLRHLNSLT